MMGSIINVAELITCLRLIILNPAFNMFAPIPLVCSTRHRKYGVPCTLHDLLEMCYWKKIRKIYEFFEMCIFIFHGLWYITDWSLNSAGSFINFIIMSMVKYVLMWLSQFPRPFVKLYEYLIYLHLYLCMMNVLH